MKHNINNYTVGSKFPHHRLRVWHKACALVQLTRRHRVGDSFLRDQVTRCMKSVIVNICEGSAYEGKRQKNHFMMAKASVIELVGAYEAAVLFGEDHPLPEILDRGGHIAAMLTKLIK